jgi:hypothetical protein
MTKIVGRLPAALCWLCVLTLVAWADDSLDQTIDMARHFDVKVVNGEMAGWEQTRLVQVKCGTNEMVFAVPHGLRVEPARDKVTLKATEGAFFLNFRVRIGTMAQDQEAARQRVLSQYDGAKIVDEYQAATQERAGRAYEMRWKPPGIGERLIRVAQVPTDAGTVEVTLVAEPSKAADGTFAFNSILTTLSKAHDGRFEIVRASGGS